MLLRLGHQWSIPPVVCALLIASATAQASLGVAAAVRAALENHPLLGVQGAEVRASDGRRQVAQARFDTRFEAELGLQREESPLSSLQRAQLPGIERGITDGSSYRLGLAREFASGLRLDAGLEVSRAELSVAGQPAAVAQVPVFAADNLARVQVSAVQPLLRGRGATSTLADQRAAELELDAAALQLLHTGSEQARQAAVAYWEYAAAQAREEVARISARRSGRLLQQTRALIAADKQPAVVIRQLQADLAAKNANVVFARQATHAAGRNLLRAMGHSRLDELPSARDALPEAGAVLLGGATEPAVLVGQAARHRRDLQAAQAQREAAEVRERAARQAQQHRLDLLASLGYSGLDSGESFSRYFSALGQDVGGADYGLGLQYSYEFGNQASLGRLQSQAAAADARRIAERDLQRQIGLDIDIAWQAVHAAGAALNLAQQAAEAEAQALDAEQRRFRQGLATVFNLIQFQDRQDLAASRRIDARQRLAVAIVNLRHACGRLLREDAPDMAPATQDFYRLPGISEGDG